MGDEEKVKFREELAKLDDVNSFGFLTVDQYEDRKREIFERFHNPGDDLSDTEDTGSGVKGDDKEEEPFFDWSVSNTLLVDSGLFEPVVLDYAQIDRFFSVLELHKDDRANVKNSFQILLESEGKKVKKVHYDSDEDDDHLFGHRYHLQWRQIRTTGVLSNKKPIIEVELLARKIETVLPICSEIPQIQSSYRVIITVVGSHIRIRGLKKKVEKTIGYLYYRMVNSIIEKLELPANIDMDFLKLPSIKDKLNLMVAPALLNIDYRSRAAIVRGSQSEVDKAIDLIRQFFLSVQVLDVAPESFGFTPYMLNMAAFNRKLSPESFHSPELLIKQSRARRSWDIKITGLKKDLSLVIDSVKKLLEECRHHYLELTANQFAYLILQSHVQEVMDSTGIEELTVSNNCIHMTGSTVNAQKALEMCQKIYDESPPVDEYKYSIPTKKIAVALIGKGGTRLEEIKLKSKVSFIKMETNRIPCIATIVGTEEQRKIAINTIKLKIKEIELDIATPAKLPKKQEMKPKARATGKSAKPVLDAPVPKQEAAVTFLDRFKGKGQAIPKAKTSNQVINLILPRHQWEIIQSIRTFSLPNQRCGPHLSLVEPFVIESRIDEAAVLLKEALANVKPFVVKLANFRHFSVENTSMLYLEPEIDPPDGLTQLLEIIRAIFPQCTDLIRNGVYTPYMSVARFSNLEDLMEAKKKIEIIFRPIEFTVKEIYVLSRIEGDPFEVKHVIKLGGDTSTSYYGEGSKESSSSEESQIGRTVLFGNLPHYCGREALRKHATKFEHEINNLQMCKNPDGKNRSCGIVEFKLRKDANAFIKMWDHDIIYVRPMYKMVYPGTVDDCCSYQTARKNPLFSSMFTK